MTRRATSKDVARSAGVSRTTVSLVLNDVRGVRIKEETREKVRDVAKKLDYHPDIAGRILASGKSYTLALVLWQNPEQIFSDAMLLQVILGMEHAAQQTGYHFLIKPLHPRNGSTYTALIRENRVDGIILSGPREDDHEIIKKHLAGFPVILMGQLPGQDIPFVDIDAVKGARDATLHLLAQNHRRIAMITNAPLEYISARQRQEGYYEALIQAGIEPDLTLIRQGDFTPESGYTAMVDLLKVSPRPTAVFVASDVVAMGAIRAIKQERLSIPNDIAVVGFDDIPLVEYFDPPLTTIRLPAYGLGWVASERLCRLVRGDSLDRTGIFLETELIVRASSVQPS